MQIRGSDARIILRPLSANKTLPTVLVHDCESVFDEATDPDITVSLDTAIKKAGNSSVKFVIAAGASAGDQVTDSITAKDLTKATKLGFWYRSSIPLDAGDYHILLDDTANCASPLETLAVPAVSAGEVNTWKYAKVELSNPSALTSIISVGLRLTVDKGAATFWLDDIRALEGDAIVIPFVNARGFGLTEALEKSNVIRGGRNPQKPTGGAITGDASMQLELNPYLTSIFKHILGACETTDLTGGKYQHDITLAPLGHGVAIEVQHTVAGKYRVYYCKGNSMSFSQSATGKLMLDTTWKVAGREATTNQTTLDGAPLDYGHNPFSAKFSTLKEGGASVAIATTFRIDVNNNVTGEPTIGSGGEMYSLNEETAEVSFSFDMLYVDDTQIDKAEAGTETSLQLENKHGTGDGSSGNEYISILTPECLFSRPQEAIEGPAGMKLAFNGIAFHDNDAGNAAIKVTFKNTQASVI